MKNLFLLLFISPLFVSLHAQYFVRYNDFGIREDSSHCFLFEDIVQAWRPNFNNYVYWNSSQKQDSIRGILWNTSTQSFDPWYYRTYSYDSLSGNETMRLLTVWQADSMKWLDIERMTFSYNQDDLLAEKLIEDQTLTTPWKNRNKTVYIYDSSGKLTQELVDVWDTALMGWVAFSKEIYQYDSLGREIFLQEEKWDANNQQWVLSNDASITWGQDNLITEELYRLFSDSALHIQTRYEPLYDSFKLLEESVSYTWNATDQVWNPASKFYYVKDSTGKLIRFGLDEWSVSQSVWEQVSYCDVFGEFWSNNTTAIDQDDLQAPILCAFPNPYRAGTPISCSDLLAQNKYTLSLWDVQGKIIQRMSFRGDEEPVLDRRLSSGLYLLRIQDQNNHVLLNRKIMIRE